MKPAYIIGALLFVIFAAIGVYYIIPMPTEHLFTTHGPNYSDKTHAIVFFGLAVISLIGARFVANSSSTSSR